jgi:two-component system, cell cycle sensor histidine kinase and response regulator CckA
MTDTDMTDAHTVLVVDDEDDLRDIMCLSLRRRGFDTLSADGARTALAVSQDHADVIDVLVTDLGLPGLTGSQLAARLLADRRDLRVLYVSGWSREVAVDRGLIEPSATVLQKPFTPDQLVGAVRAVLLAPVGAD